MNQVIGRVLGFLITLPILFYYVSFFPFIWILEKIPELTIWIYRKSRSLRRK